LSACCEIMRVTKKGFFVKPDSSNKVHNILDTPFGSKNKYAKGIVIELQDGRDIKRKNPVIFPRKYCHVQCSRPSVTAKFMMMWIYIASSAHSSVSYETFPRSVFICLKLGTRQNGRWFIEPPSRRRCVERRSEEVSNSTQKPLEIDPDISIDCLNVSSVHQRYPDANCFGGTIK